MRNIYIICFFYLVSFTNLSSQGGDRNVMWVHGLGGLSDSWTTNSGHHQAKYQMNCGGAAYGKGPGAKECGEIVKGQFNDFFGSTATDPRNIAIAHSFGGLVSRGLEKSNEEKHSGQNFGGQILVHSPQGGAKFADNFMSGFFDKKFAEMWDKLTKPIRADELDEELVLLLTDAIFKVSPFIKDKVSLKELLKLLELFMTAVNSEGEDVLKLFHEQLEIIDFNDVNKIKDLGTENDFIKDLKEFDGPGELISIWGAEETNIAERLLSSMLAKPGNKMIDIVSDENKLLRSMAGIYKSAGVLNRVLGKLADFRGINLFHNTPYHERARLWYEGADYLVHGFETDWLILIGAITYEERITSITEMTQACRIKYDEYQTLLEDFHRTGEFKNIQEVMDALNALIQNPDCYENKTYRALVPVQALSDGVVLIESQQAAGGIFFENKNCNHFEALNTKVLSHNFTRIFEFGDNGSTWFKTELR